MNKKIAFITAIIPRYKVWLYEELGKNYKENFFAIHGPEMRDTVPKDISDIKVRNNLRVRVRYFLFKGIDFIWIPIAGWVIKNKPKVIILQDGVRIISNYIVHLYTSMYGGNVFYYSHGHNHQASLNRNSIVSRVTEKLRKFLLQRSDGIIVYTRKGEEFLRKEKISVPIYISYNTLDTHNLIPSYAQISEEDIVGIRKNLGLTEKDYLITFLGRLVEEKKVDHVIDLLDYLNNTRNFKVYGLIVGDGPLRERLEKKACNSPVIFTGYKTGIELKKRILASDIIYLPGMVGLAIIEAFCAGKPLVTINHTFHSPEIEYLVHNENGLLLEKFDLQQESEKIISLLEDKERLERISQNALNTAKNICSSDKMLGAFIKCIDDALDKTN